MDTDIKGFEESPCFRGPAGENPVGERSFNAPRLTPGERPRKEQTSLPPCVAAAATKVARGG